MRFGSASFSVMGDQRQDFIAEPVLRRIASHLQARSVMDYTFADPESVTGAVSTPSREYSNSTAGAVGPLPSQSPPCGTTALGSSGTTPRATQASLPLTDREIINVL